MAIGTYLDLQRSWVARFILNKASEMVKKHKDSLLTMLNHHRHITRTWIRRREEIKTAQHMNERYFHKKVQRIAELYGPSGVFAKLRKSS